MSESKSWCWEVNDWRKKSGLTCSFVVFSALNIAMMYFGIKNLKNCPIQPLIPIYLIVSGSTSLSLLLVRLAVSHFLLPSNDQQKEEDEENGEERNSEFILKALRVYDTLASTFSTCWLIVGSIYVYGSHPVYEISDPNFCDYTSYILAFVVITIGYASLALSIIAAILHCSCFNK